MIVGMIQYMSPPLEVALSIAFPGRSMKTAIQASPQTLEKEVPISATTTSHKRMGPFIEGERHR